MKITVLGAGAWGTALAKVLHENGNVVALWDIDGETLEELRHGRSERYLPGVKLPVNCRERGRMRCAGHPVAVFPAGRNEFERASGHSGQRDQRH